MAVTLYREYSHFWAQKVHRQVRKSLILCAAKRIREEVRETITYGLS
jgi:hypothetical protein